MATTALTLPSIASATRTRTARLYLREFRYELLRAARNRSFSLTTLGFPVMFYVLFGVLMNRGEHIGSTSVAKYMLASYACFGTVGAALFGIGVGLALERTSGWLELKRASPMPPFAYLVARCAMAVTFSLLIVNVLCGIGIAFAGVHLSLVEYTRMLAITVAGSLPFAGLGLLLATLLPANAAPGIVNMIYLPMSYCSGLWVPVVLLPRFVQHLAPFLPSYHLSQWMLGAVGYTQGGDATLRHAAALLAFTVAFLGLAIFSFRRMDNEA